MNSKAVVKLSWEVDVGGWYLPCGCAKDTYINHIIEEEDFYGDLSYEYGECHDCGAVFYMLGGCCSVYETVSNV